MSEYFNYEPLPTKPASQILSEELNIDIPNPIQDNPLSDFKEKDIEIKGLNLNGYFINDDKEYKMTNNNTNNNFSKLLEQNGITGQKKTFLTKIAKLESAYNQYATNNKSSASGWFQFTDSTRRMFTNADKNTFLKDGNLQIQTASKLYDSNYNYLKRNGLLDKLKQRGMTVNEAIALTWLNPTWAKEYILTGKNAGSDGFGTSPSIYLNKYRNA